MCTVTPSRVDVRLVSLDRTGGCEQVQRTTLIDKLPVYHVLYVLHVFRCIMW